MQAFGTALPLRFVADNLGCRITWNPVGRTVAIELGSAMRAQQAVVPASTTWSGRHARAGTAPRRHARHVDFRSASCARQSQCPLFYD
jgi:hypothetical protein